MERNNSRWERIVVGLLLLIVIELAVLDWAAVQVSSNGVTIEMVEGE